MLESMSFNLHRPEGGLADWEHIPAEERNAFQTVAASTHGVITPANALDVAALCLLENGLYDIRRGHYNTGTLKLAGAIGEDALNGMVADKTGTKSPLGELVDAGGDLFRSTRMLSVLTKEDFVPGWVAQAILARKAVNGLATGVARLRGAETHTTKAGKLAETAQNAMVLSSVGRKLAKLNDRKDLTRYATAALVVSTAAFTGYGLFSSAGYWKVALQKKPQRYHPSMPRR